MDKAPAQDAHLERKDEHKQSGPRRDDIFYADIVPVVFKVEDRIFRVRRDKFLQPGSFFETMFSLPLGHQSEEGQSDENPIVLQGIKPEAFQSLLRVMYPGFVDGMTPCKTYDEWMGVLELSTMWDLPSSRTEAVAKLTPAISELSEGERIVIGQKYQVRSWLMDVYCEITMDCNRVPQNEFIEEGVDATTIHKLTTVRDIWMSKWPRVLWERSRKKCCEECHYPRKELDCRFHNRAQVVNDGFQDMVREEVVPCVESMFKDELAGMKD